MIQKSHDEDEDHNGTGPMTAADHPADIPAGHLHQSKLLKRGWDKRMIRAELRSHAVRTKSQVDACTSPLWYPIAAVEAAESGNAFRDHRAEAAAAEEERRAAHRAKRAASASSTAARNALIGELDPELVEHRGRRVYVNCGYESQLGFALREIGAKWDSDEKRLWVGTGKAELLPPLLAAHRERKRVVADTLATGLWVTIPYTSGETRARAKELGAVWEPTSRRWAMPDQQSRDEVAALLAAEESREAATPAKDAKNAAKRAATRADILATGLWVTIPYTSGEARARAKELGAVWEPTSRRWAMPDQQSRDEVAALLAAEASRGTVMDSATRAAAERRDQEERRAKILADSGRTPTGETELVVRISTTRMNKAAALSRAHKLGAVIELGDGRRGVVIDRDVWFTSDDMASSACWHPETHDEAHWDYRYEVAVVAPTELEAARDAARRAAEADAHQVHVLFDRLGRGGELREEWTSIPDHERTGTITMRYGSGWPSNDGGTIILSRDHVFYQHPGHYDDWRRTERVHTDSDTVAEVRAVISAGDREVTARDQMAYRYTIKGSDA